MNAGLLASDPATLGPYRLLGRLGSGGMGQVFLGKSPGGRLVAVKVIRPDLAADPEFRKRFAREVAHAKNVNGMFTAVLADADTDGPVPWLATAYIPGPPLAVAARESGPLPLSSLVPLAAGLAEALAAIHAAGMVHRDLKPSNVLLAADGPRVIDFGISHAAEASTLTQPGVIMGTPGFMSPEQADEQAVGQAVGQASDVFSLGAVLAFAATGKPPFGAGSTATLLYRVIHEQPNLDGVPPELLPLIKRCMAKAPGDRPSPRDLLEKLGSDLIPENWLPEKVADTFPRYEPSARIAALTSVEPSLVRAAASGTPAQEAAAPQALNGEETREQREQAQKASVSQTPAREALAPEAPAAVAIAQTGQVPQPGGRHRALATHRWSARLPQRGRAVTAVAAMVIAAIAATGITLAVDGGTVQVAGTAAGQRGHGSPKAALHTAAPAIQPTPDPTPSSDATTSAAAPTATATTATASSASTSTARSALPSSSPQVTNSDSSLSATGATLYSCSNYPTADNSTSATGSYTWVNNFPHAVDVFSTYSRFFIVIYESIPANGSVTSQMTGGSVYEVQSPASTCLGYVLISGTGGTITVSPAASQSAASRG
jgi:serine/threonine protein kinase